MENAANFKVFQASAGSGKTYTIIKEYLKLCLKSEAHVANFKNILAITFTNAAANEMKAKIVNSLCELIESKEFKEETMEADLVKELDISDADLKHNAQRLMTVIMHDYSSFCVSTIDAFVQKLSRTFAHDLGLPSQYSVSIDTDEVAETITERIGLQISDENTFLTSLLVDFSDNQFDNQRSNALEDQLSAFVKKLMTEKAYQKDENNNIKNVDQYRQTLDFLSSRISFFEQRLKTFADDYKAVEHRFGLTTDDYWQKKSGVGSFVDKLAKKVYDKPNSYFYTAISNRKCLSNLSKVEANDALLAVLEPLESFYESEYGKYLFYKSQRNLLYLYALRSQIREAFSQLAEEEEVVHISEFNKLLNSVMGDFSVPFVYERIGERYQHIFVDEFQDTSVMQWQNLIPLVDNGLAAGQMSMVVGDGKQSIYRFRSGEVEQIVNLPDIYTLPDDERQPAFRQYQENLRNNFVFRNLDTNYRSFSNVVEFNNAFFGAAIEELSTESRKVYINERPNTKEGVSIRQKTKKKEAGLVQIELYDPESQPDYSFERVEFLVRDLTENRGYRYEDITLLTRDNKYGSLIANYLNDKGIPVVSQVSILLKSSDKVQLLVNTLRYLMDESNEVSIANLLYYGRLVQQPPFDGDVSRLFESVEDIAQGHIAVESVMGIGEAGLLRAELSKATCLYDFCASLQRIFRFDTIRDAYLNYFMEEVFSWQVGTKEGIVNFLSLWDKKQDKLAVKSVGSNAVNIMTIHKSKGLEFPVVIYPDAITNLDEKLSNEAPEEWLQPQDLGFDPIPNLNRVIFKMDKSAANMGDLALQHIEKEQESNRLDNLNLLYVAFTRAAQCLYVFAKQKKSEKNNLFGDFTADHPVKFTAVEESDSAKVYRLGDVGFSNPNKHQDVVSDNHTAVDSVSADWFERIQVDASPTQYWRSENDPLQPREWGELVHQILSKIRTADEVDAVLSRYLNEGKIDVMTAEWIRDKFVQLVNDPLLGDAFNAKTKIKTECEILHQGHVIRLDRYVEMSDVICLIDYKTGKHEDEHRVQIQNYAQALREMTDKPIRAYLVYLSESVEVKQVVC